MMFVNPYIDIAIISIALAIVSQIIQAKFVNTPEVKEKRNALNEKSKKIRELLKKKDAKALEEMKKIQSEMSGDYSAIMKTMPYAFLTLPLYLVAFGYMGGNVLPFLGGIFVNGAYSELIFNLPIPLPWLDFQLHSTTNWLGYYAVWILLSTIIIKVGLVVFEKMNKKKENKEKQLNEKK